jgi:hypothetical protein
MRRSSSTPPQWLSPYVGCRAQSDEKEGSKAAVVAGMVSDPGTGGKEGVSDHLPELLDARALRAELGVTRAAAEAIMRLVPTVQIPSFRKTYCRRSDVARLLEERTFEKDKVAI